MRLDWTRLALERILELAEFRFPDDPARRQAWMGQVIEYAERLQRFPSLGPPISSTNRSEASLRRLLFKDVWIVYEVKEDRVLILTVRHVREKPDEP